MATKFGLGAEVQSPTGLYVYCLSVGRISNIICERTFVKFSGGAGRGAWLKEESIRFWWRPGFFRGSWIIFFRILHQYKIGHIVIGAATCRICMN